MKKYVIFGTNGMAKDLCNFIESDGDEAAAFTLDREYIREERFFGKKVIAYDELEKHFSKDEITVLVMVGYSRMSEIRKAILERCEKDGWDISSFIHSSVFNLSKSIGDGNIIAPFVDIGSDVVIGRGNIISTHTVIGHESIVGDYNFYSTSVHFGGAVRVGDHNFFGLNCTVEDGTRIDGYDIVGSGTHLNRDMESHMVAAPQAVRLQRVGLRGMDLLLLKRFNEKNSRM